MRYWPMLCLLLLVGMCGCASKPEQEPPPPGAAINNNAPGAKNAPAASGPPPDVPRPGGMKPAPK